MCMRVSQLLVHAHEIGARFWICCSYAGDRGGCAAARTVFVLAFPVLVSACSVVANWILWKRSALLFHQHLQYVHLRLFLLATTVSMIVWTLQSVERWYIWCMRIDFSHRAFAAVISRFRLKSSIFYSSGFGSNRFETVGFWCWNFRHSPTRSHTHARTHTHVIPHSLTNYSQSIQNISVCRLITKTFKLIARYCTLNVYSRFLHCVFLFILSLTCLSSFLCARASYKILHEFCISCAVDILIFNVRWMESIVRWTIQTCERKIETKRQLVGWLVWNSHENKMMLK